MSGANTFGGTAAVTVGTLLLSGTNAYSGGSIVNGGFLELAFNRHPGTGTITVNSGGTVNAPLYAITQAFLDDITSTSAA